MKATHYSRRNLLRYLGASGLLAHMPLSFALSGSAGASKNLPKLIMFELFGGNDNLNTLVPYKDDLYQSYRPSIALKPKEFTALNDELAFNNALSPLFATWEQGQLAIVQDVGSDNTSLSHFKAIKLMEKSLASPQNDSGWVANTLANNPSLTDEKWDLPSVWAGGHMESLIGAGMTPYSPSKGAFSHYLDKYHAEDVAQGTHLIDKTISSYAHYAEMLADRVTETGRFDKRFHSYDSEEAAVGNQCADVIRLIEAGISAPVYKIGMSGFDLHSSLRGKHEILLNRAARNIDNLRQSLIELGEWNNTVILVYSEFGRRPTQNASLGTDHGSSAPMFLLGGKVNGGIKGDRADLADLNSDGNLRYKTDYRTVFSTVVSGLWQAQYNPFLERNFHPIDNIIRA